MMYDHIERARSIFNDLVAYTQRPEELVKQRCNYSTHELAWLWESYKDNPLEFYRETDLYIFDLTKYQSMLVPTVNFMTKLANDKKITKVLDLGGGIGEYTIRFLQEVEGAEVTYLDLKDSKTVEYAQYRFKKHEVEPTIVDENFDWHSQEWDAVIAMDVLEHMEQEVADKAMKALQKNVKYVYANPEQLQYNSLYPQHITRYSLDGFSRFDVNLYENISKKSTI